MNALAVAVLAYLLIATEAAVRAVVEGAVPGPSPLMVLPLVVFLALFGPPVQVLWAALALGSAVDLVGRFPLGAAASASADGAAAAGGGGGLQTVVVLGPNALGYFVAAYFVLTVRALVFRRNPLTFIVLSVLGAGLAGVTAVGVLTLRAAVGFGVPIDPAASPTLTGALLTALYTGVSGAVLVFAFRPLSGALGLADGTARRYAY